MCHFLSNHIRNSVLAGLLLFLGFQSGKAQSSGSVAGKVYLNSKPVAEAGVAIIKKGIPIIKGETAHNGSYFFGFLNPGKYSIRVSVMSNHFWRMHLRVRKGKVIKVIFPIKTGSQASKGEKIQFSEISSGSARPFSSFIFSNGFEKFKL